MNRRSIALNVMSEALQLRQRLGYSVWDAVCPYDCAERIGIEVRFLGIPSLEALYLKEPGPVILVSSLRPPGRAAYSCAHEIGHHIYKHGTRIDHNLSDIRETNKGPEEFIAQTFAGYFLMPKSAVEAAFARRSWSIGSSTPEMIYSIAGWLGVGYETLINHMEYALRIMGPQKANLLRSFSPSSVKTKILGYSLVENLIIVDRHWIGRSIDVETGDLILLWPNVRQTGELARLEKRTGGLTLLRATGPGTGELFDDQLGWSVGLRVAKRGYTGRNKYRHLFDKEYEEV